MSGGPRRPAPGVPVTPELAEFWSATTQGRLTLPTCRACQLVFWYPRPVCPGCAGTDVTFVDASGQGTVYTYTVNRRPPPPYDSQDWLIIAYVSLAEGPCILTNIVDCEPDEVRIGLAVEVVFDEVREGAARYRFRPQRAGS